MHRPNYRGRHSVINSWCHMTTISSIEELQALFNSPKERSIKKALTELDAFGRRFISLSPLVVLSTVSSQGKLDASPRGGGPGFVKAFDANTLLIPDWPGNNRLDSFRNIIETGHAGLLFMIPGFNELFRVNGKAVLETAPELLSECCLGEKQPKLVVVVTIEEAYLHCAKALMRSQLWDPDSQVPRDTMPTMGQMLKVQTASREPVETQEEMLERYRKELY